MTPEEYSRTFDSRVADVLTAAAERVGPLRDRLAGIGMASSQLRDSHSLGVVPVLSKDEVIALQASDPPFGGMLAPQARLRRVFQSPGPIYEPEPDEPDHWRWAPALQVAGFGPDDLVLNAFGYHLSPAGAMFEEGARAVGCGVVPAGIGNADLQAQACVHLGVTAYIGLPSYLKALLEKAEEADLRLMIRKAFVTAEPLPTSLRAWLQERIPVVHQGYGTAEAGNLGYECTRMEGLHVPDDALIEIVDLSTGEPFWDGRVGQVVATVFSEQYPLVRFGTGDLSAYLTEPCGCGLPTPRLKGWLGRVGEAVKVRGMFLHPRQVEQVMGKVAGIDRYRFVVDRVEHLDGLRCEVVLSPGSEVDRVFAEIRDQVRSGLRFNVEVFEVESLDADMAIDDVRSWE